MKTNPDDFIRGPKIINPYPDEPMESIRKKSESLRNELQSHPPLTKREYFAAMAMQGLVAVGYKEFGTWNDLGMRAVEAADALIEELNKENT